jgi:hypothetical protein
MAGITKRARVDKLLEKNAKRQAALGFDSTKEERLEADREWALDLASAFKIDPKRAKDLMAKDEIDIKSVVSELITERQSLIDGGHWNDEVDELYERVWEIFKDSHAMFELDFVLESLSKLGMNPVLVNDENGNWSFIGTGCFDINKDEDPTHVTVIVSPDEWSASIREALTKFLES